MKALATLALLVSASCVAPGPADLDLKPLARYAKLEKIPSKAILHLDSEFCKSHASENGILIGPAVCENARTIVGGRRGALLPVRLEWRNLV